jgi:hypothetical protein
MSFSAVGQVFDRVSFRKHLKTQNLSWATGGVTIHHTGSPDMDIRPQGWTIQHMRNIASYYRDTMGWSSGPHLFTDENEIFGMSPLGERGVHAVSFNSSYVGIEMLGYYDKVDDDDPKTGRGLEIMKTTAAATAQLLIAMGKKVDGKTVTFHRDDPKTTKTCPGDKIDKEWFLGLVRQAYDEEVKIEKSQGDRIDQPEPEKPAATASPLLDALKALRVMLDKVITQLGG